MDKVKLTILFTQALKAIGDRLEKMDKGKFILFFAEAFKRWGTKSPKYMRIWRTINGIICFIGGFGLSLTQLTAIFPGIWPKVIFAVLSACGSYGFTMNTLTVAKPNDLPLTEKIQAEEEIKKEQAK